MPVVFQFQPTLDTCVGLRNCDCRARGKLSGNPPKFRAPTIAIAQCQRIQNRRLKLKHHRHEVGGLSHRDK